MPINSYSASVTGSLTAIKEPKPFLSQVDNFFYRIYSAVRLCFFNVCVRVCVCVRRAQWKFSGHIQSGVQFVALQEAELPDFFASVA